MAPKKKTSTRKSVKELAGKSAKSSTISNGHANGHSYEHNRKGRVQMNGLKNGHHSDVITMPPLSHASSHTSSHTHSITLRSQTTHALNTYFTNLNGHAPGELYNLVIREVEEPLFRAVLGYVDGNQSRAAEVLGINRGTLRKKLREYGLHDA